MLMAQMMTTHAARPIRSESGPQIRPPIARITPSVPKINDASGRLYPMSTSKRVWCTTMVMVHTPVMVTARDSSQKAGVRTASPTVAPDLTGAVRVAGRVDGPSGTRPMRSAEWRWNRRLMGINTTIAPMPNHHIVSRHPMRRINSALRAATPREPRPTPARDTAEASPRRWWNQRGTMAMCGMNPSAA